MRIVADSSCDMVSGQLACFRSVPMLMYTDKNEFLDDGTIDIETMLQTFENHKGRSYTSCPSVDAWIQAFGEEDEVYVIAITSGLSGTYNSAMIARETYLQDHPDAKVVVFDSLSTGPEMKMAIEKIYQLKQEGKVFEEIVPVIQKYLDDTHLFFVLGSVHNLAENGRVNKVIASAVGVLGLSIIGVADEKGTIKQIGKGRSTKKIVAFLKKEMVRLGYNGGKIRMDHVLNETLPKAIADAIHADFPEADIEFYPATGLCSYYAERGGMILGFEC